MERWNGRVALVTGASSGIGAGICRELVKHGVIVVGCARSVEKIEALAEENDIKSSRGCLHAVKCDLNQESDILSTFDFIRGKFGRLDICINNAGMSTDSTLLRGKTTDWSTMLQVNIMALCICTREAFKLMSEKGIDDGQIIHISSVVGHRALYSPLHSFNFYAGTKTMVKALTESLRREVLSEKAHIRVSSISPGSVETNFTNQAFDSEQRTTFYSSFQSLTPKDISDAVIYILQCPAHVVVNDIIILPVEQPI